MSPSKGGGQGKSEGFGGSSRRTNDNVQKTFSNICLDTPFISPEVLFSQLTGQTTKMDVWGFGMIMFCLLFGKKPVSYYQAYRQWYLK
jgi:serine/threonine protein kinase